MIELFEGTYVVDTPGIREFQPADVDERELGYHFREFRPYLDQCRFPACLHDREPDCAVKAAAEAGGIHPLRYEGYLKILHSLKD
jgi:ribosome biogenesis GTPase